MTATMRVILADDEAMARKRLTRLLRELPDVEIIAEYDNGADALARIAQGGVDVVLLDIHMPGLDGLATLRLLPDDGPYVIFCTAHAEHALDAFDAGAIDYVLKPVEAERLSKALSRARLREVRQRFREEISRHRVQSVPRIPVPTRDGIVLLDPANIRHLSLEGELLTIATTQGRYLSDSTLQELESRLPRSFMRVHRRALLNLERVVRLEPCETGGFVARTDGGDGVVVSRQAARELRRMLGMARRTAEADDDPDE